MKTKTEYYHKNSDVVAFKRIDDYDGYWQEFTYDKNGNQLTLKNSDGHWSESTYDTMGNKVTYKDSDGYWSESTYDERGNEIRSRFEDGVWVEKTYDEEGNKLTYKDSLGYFEIKGEKVTEKEFNKFVNKQRL